VRDNAATILEGSILQRAHRRKNLSHQALQNRARATGANTKPTYAYIQQDQTNTKK
jgi:hypothetical protein